MTADERFVPECCIDSPFEPCRPGCPLAPSPLAEFLQAVAALLADRRFMLFIGSINRVLRSIEDSEARTAPS